MLRNEDDRFLFNSSWCQHGEVCQIPGLPMRTPRRRLEFVVKKTCQELQGLGPWGTSPRLVFLGFCLDWLLDGTSNSVLPWIQGVECGTAPNILWCFVLCVRVAVQSLEYRTVLCFLFLEAFQRHSSAPVCAGICHKMLHRENSQ